MWGVDDKPKEIRAAMIPRETKVGLMTLCNLNMVVSALEVKGKHKGFCHEVE